MVGSFRWARAHFPEAVLVVIALTVAGCVVYPWYTIVECDVLDEHRYVVHATRLDAKNIEPYTVYPVYGILSNCDANLTRVYVGEVGSDGALAGTVPEHKVSVVMELWGPTYIGTARRIRTGPVCTIMGVAVVVLVGLAWLCEIRASLKRTVVVVEEESEALSSVVVVSAIH